MSDLCDGEACKSHCEALQILLYYADVEVTNPLGSQTKVHKVGKLDVMFGLSVHASDTYNKHSEYGVHVMEVWVGG